jgi:hypothetical protein
MESTVYQVLLNLVAAAIGWLASITFNALKRQRIRNRRLRAFCDFFGSSGHLLVIHSAVLDAPTSNAVGVPMDYPVYNYPATDIRATRLLARLFESVGLKEGIGFTVLPDIRVKADGALWNSDIVLLCGPARNHVFRDLCPVIQMRYIMEVDAQGSNVLRDTLRGRQQLLASRELPQPTSEGDFDYGLLASLPNPYNQSRRVVILAGIHGTGTVGAAQFLSTGKGLQEVSKKKQSQVVSELVKASYDGDIETPTSLKLA